MNSEMIKLTHRKLNPIIFYLVCGVLLFFYIQYIWSRESKAHIMFLIISSVILIYLLIFSFWIDSVTINRTNGTVLSERGVWPFKRVTKTRTTFFEFVTVAVFVHMGTKRRYQISLLESIESKPFPLISCYDIEDAWKKTVKIAKHLDFPIYDLMINGYVWKKDKIPNTLGEREKIISHL